ncbi:protein kinase domain-containing protein [Microbacterium sp. Marseille-Q6965]|uniref:protein kinase domain-containing protein n=1 Tax=Microbacterium sp. Marseille-Q6965 TaxID=2965072 RepID=UPI0021B83E92|nr:protein kinase [Microbacterium sp. Marseille-Q6965]
MRPTQGVTFGGRYELSSRIAIGGMGEVWEATDHVIGRTVAIKILKDEYMGDPGFLERFRAEARHAALVNHEGIASVFDYGEENGSAFLVMELVPGEALSTILERETALPPERTLDIVGQTAAALQAAHAAGLVHRDIKPGNLLITPDGRVKITDFGIARIADQVPLTATGQVMGTVQYLSPEQASGHQASPATDIYSLGIVAYESLAGKRPFTGESQVAIAMAQINDAPPPLPADIPQPVQNLVMAMIAKKPEDRPASAAAVSRACAALRRGDVAAAAAAVPAIAAAGALADEGFTQLLGTAGDGTTQLIPATSPLPVATDEEVVEEEPKQKKKRSPWTWPLIALIALLLIAVIGTVIALFANRDEAPEPAPETSSSAPRPTPTRTTSTPTPTGVDIDALQLNGRTCDEATALLTAEGSFQVNCPTGNAASSQDQVGLVYNVDPRGVVPEGSTITLTVYGEMVDLPAPGSGPRFPEVVTTGQPSTVYWDYYQCPSGAGSLTGYTVTLHQGATFADDGSTTRSFGADVTQAQINVTGPAASSVSASYAAICGDRESAASGSTSQVINGAEDPEPSPGPSPTTTPGAEGGGEGNGGQG